MLVVEELRREVVRALSALGVPAGDGIAVACSNGPDSLVLADALIAVRPGGVAIISVDHGLRPEAAGEAAAVRTFAQERGVAAEIVRVEVVRDGRGLEDAARRARYAALDAAADRLGAPWIALGHTASDQAETVLGRLLRGAGAAGLAGIPPRRGRYVRPLLAVSRARILTYVAARGLAPAHDPMNDDPALLRTRLRHVHLPALCRENPALEAALCRAAEAVRETVDALDWMAARIPVATDGATARLAVADLRAVPPAVARRALARQAEALGAPLEGRHLDALLALTAGPAAGTRRLDLPRLAAARVYDHLVLAAPGAVVARVLPDAPAGYTVRTWRPGDRMRPARLRGRSRKLQDLLTDRKVPRDQRSQVQVMVRERDGAIVWAEHIGPSIDARDGVDGELALTIFDSPVIYD